MGRGAGKLLAALDAWAEEGLDVTGRRCIDVGASTGGFTHVLLDRGAREVVALDVGHGQLAAELAGDPRVVERSGTSVRGLTAADVGGPGDVVVVDLSFISLTVVLGDLRALLGDGGDLVLLVKPQFEVGRDRLSGSGVVTDPADRVAAVERVLAAARALHLHPHGLIPSPVRGSTGNTEYLVWVRPWPSATMTGDRTRAILRATTTEKSTGGRR